MVKRHIKRLTVPKTWNVTLKENKYITKHYPAGHPMELSIPLVVMLRDTMKVARTAKEVLEIIHNKEIYVDNVRVKEIKYGVGLMDVVEIRALNKFYRLVLSPAGMLEAVEIPAAEAHVKPMKIIKKSMLKKGKMQINLLDGSNVLSDMKCSVGDTAVFDVKSKKITDLLAFEAGNYVYLIAGKNIGVRGVIDSINDNIITISTDDGNKLQTLKEYGMILGKKSPVVHIA